MSGPLLHAHPTAEAVAIEDECRGIQLQGDLTSGGPHSAVILIPQAFSYMMMKLFAFHDRRNDPQKDLGQHHALDLYRTIAMMTEDEHEVAIRLKGQHKQNPEVLKAGLYVREYFSSVDSLGTLRLREHQHYSEDMDTATFLDTIVEFFPPVA